MLPSSVRTHTDTTGRQIKALHINICSITALDVARTVTEIVIANRSAQARNAPGEQAATLLVPGVALRTMYVRSFVDPHLQVSCDPSSRSVRSNSHSEWTKRITGLRFSTE